MSPVVLHLASADWIVVLAYAGLVLYLGLKGSRLGRSTTEEFVLGGRLLTLPAFVAALVSTWYGGILGIGEFTYRFGIANWVVFGAPYYVFAIVFAVFFARKVRESAVYSIPDLLYRVYDRRNGLFGSLLVFFLSSPAPYFLMLAILVQVVTGLPFLPCLLAGVTMTVASVYAGGFRAVVRTDVLQFCLMFGGFFVLLAYLVPAHGIAPFLGERLPASHLTPTGGNSWQYILVWFFIALWTLVAPQFHQFTLSAKTPRTAQWGIVVSVVCWAVFDAATTLSGLYARALLPGLPDPAMAFPLLGDSVLPSVAKGVFYVGMLATVLSTTDGLAFIAAVTVGRDVFGVLLKKISRPSDTVLTQWGILVTAGVATASVLLFPSVISLWYVIGTLFIPGLLLPLISAYYRRLRLSPAWTFTAMTSGFACSLAAFLAGVLRGTSVAPRYPWGIEPMYVGLAVSLVIYLIGHAVAPSRRA